MMITDIRNKKYANKIKEFCKAIEQFDSIAIFRHIRPDYDAFGSQFGLAYFLKDNFPNKEIITLGNDSSNLEDKCFPKNKKIENKWFERNFLAIVVDCSTADRISDERFKFAKYIIKIDHHPDVDNFANLNIVDTSMIAAAELIANICITLNHFSISQNCAHYLYKGIVGDSGRFMFSSTSAHTFFIAQKLTETGIDLNKIYDDMYTKKLSQLENECYILQNYKISKKGIAYYVLDKKTLEKMDLPAERGKEFVNIFSHIEGIKIWMSVSEDVPNNEWRVSIRSVNNVKVNVVAEKYNGGGHDNASGAKLSTIDDLPLLINDLENLL